MIIPINHPEAVLYEHFYGPKIPLPNDEEGTIFVEDDEDED